MVIPNTISLESRAMEFQMRRCVSWSMTHGSNEFKLPIMSFDGFSMAFKTVHIDSAHWKLNS